MWREVPVLRVEAGPGGGLLEHKLESILDRPSPSPRARRSPNRSQVLVMHSHHFLPHPPNSSVFIFFHKSQKTRKKRPKNVRERNRKANFLDQYGDGGRGVPGEALGGGHHEAKVRGGGRGRGRHGVNLRPSHIARPSGRNAGLAWCPWATAPGLEGERSGSRRDQDRQGVRGIDRPDEPSPATPRVGRDGLRRCADFARSARARQGTPQRLPNLTLSQPLTPLAPRRRIRRRRPRSRRSQVELQINQRPGGAVKILAGIVKGEGVAGLWRGNTINLLR